MIIGFTRNTSKIISKLLCRNFRHCAVVKAQSTNSKKQLFIFMHKVKGGIHILEVSKRDLKLLEKHGWVFIDIDSNHNLLPAHFIGCVGFVKGALGIRNPFIWTPDQLYRYLTK